MAATKADLEAAVEELQAKLDTVTAESQTLSQTLVERDGEVASLKEQLANLADRLDSDEGEAASAEPLHLLEECERLIRMSPVGNSYLQNVVVYMHEFRHKVKGQLQQAPDSLNSKFAELFAHF